MDLVFGKAPIPDGRPGFGSYSSLCPNCDERFGGAGPNRVYCGLRCSSEAEAVRYGRKKVREYPDGWPDDISYAVNIQIAHALAGGYARSERRLSPEVRAEVISRAGGRCELCGEPGVEIDHIDGPSPDLTNLRLLCRSCHEEITRGRLVPISDEATVARRDEIWRRIRADAAERPSDDEQWGSKWRQWLKAHRRPDI